eukprot:TRINITY_DN11073_c0_g1_i1.p1 TRINITY_DN11073_c0_g1~~TRINITY_DN11073_c0_g1_i1.p1  ORF type:complete len:196 (+),score=56.67 TRINITY_DN11073_c0_g1_i1:377-964(+)
MQKLLARLKRDYSNLLASIKKYETKNNSKLDYYKGISRQLSSITEQHKAVDATMHNFEISYKALSKETLYFNQQLKWHEDFLSSYKALLNEFKRRVGFERRAEEEAKSFGKKLATKFEEEVKKRNKFKEKALRYFPPPLQPLLFELPIKYEVFPIEQKSSILDLHDRDNAVFERICNETARSEITIEELTHKKNL